MKIRIKKFKVRPAHWNSDGDMDYLMGKTRVAKKSNWGNFSVVVKRKNENCFWFLMKSDYTVIKEK